MATLKERVAALKAQQAAAAQQAQSIINQAPLAQEQQEKSSSTSPATIQPEAVTTTQAQQVVSVEKQENIVAAQPPSDSVARIQTAHQVSKEPVSDMQKNNIPSISTELFNNIEAKQDYYVHKKGKYLEVKYSIDNYNQFKKAGYVYGVLDNDSYIDKEGHLKVKEEKLVAKSVESPGNGSLDFKSDGTFKYTPNPGFHGIDKFTYHICDGFKCSNTAIVKIEVENNAPKVKHDKYSVSQNSVLNVQVDKSSNLDKLSTEFGETKFFGVLENDTDENDDKLTAEVVSTPKHGKLDFYRDGTFTYTPDKEYIGTDNFKYKAFDGAVYSEEGTVSITITRANKPVANDDDYSVKQDGVLTVSKALPGLIMRWGTTGILGNDYYKDKKALKAQVETLPQNGLLTYKPDGTFKYQPNSGFSGDDSFTYKACAEEICSDIATVFITVQPINNFQDEL